MPTVYTLEQGDATPGAHVEFIAFDGAKYRIKFDRLEGGLEINKTCDTGASEAILVYPHCSNQIRVK